MGHARIQKKNLVGGRGRGIFKFVGEGVVWGIFSKMFLCKFKKKIIFGWGGGSGRSPSPSRSTHRGTELKVNGECTLRLYSTHNGQLINSTYREISQLLKTIYISWSEYKNVATYAQVDFNEIWDKYLGCFSSCLKQLLID